MSRNRNQAASEQFLSKSQSVDNLNQKKEAVREVEKGLKPLDPRRMSFFDRQTAYGLGLISDTSPSGTLIKASPSRRFDRVNRNAAVASLGIDGVRPTREITVPTNERDPRTIDKAAKARCAKALHLEGQASECQYCLGRGYMKALQAEVVELKKHIAKLLEKMA